MLKKRIIPCLDIRDGRTVKGVHFVDIRDAGDPVELVRQYVRQGADELVFLDITATVEKRKTLTRLVKRIAEQISIPFTVGGGISSVQDVSALIRAGADKVSVNSAAVMRPELIGEIAREFGSQCVVVAVDTKRVNGEWVVYVHGGRTPVAVRTLDWVRQACEAGAGEVLLTSMDHDGTREGFALDITQKVCEAVPVPVIASGGAGRAEHFATLFRETAATGGLAAGIFHYGDLTIEELKQYLKTQNIQVR
ncbi:MAG: imidazole glycerol phosphate synthase subunit HisF [Bacteroidales bacterium]|jgi:cyclase|nr:imidazole glycerol phosphate synthase subunit HisF [Bacteroidales bacterium]MDD3101022.1 imidazole glycerol phosphate synthase subunit HisF [Bacteroidales bacterium]MDD3639911.1 imidazole glycerol phosphate synthase subunit HisF [Bacteroidales bacterium]MDD3944952.1 imidazole glycerol phosphate synthase subunit HisF [Bacteroidales bacterium]MDD4481146.1 imidazole glycerol phosphate synthase subunit HisF [Bacteroidales bacterium]